MKKLMVILTLSILMLSTTSYGYVHVNIIPKEITPNTDTVYVVYELNCSVPVSNFSLNLESEGIQFDNASINISYIEKNKEISGKIVGKIINNSMEKYDIPVYSRYILDDSLISSIMYYHIYRVNESIYESLYNKSDNISTINKSTNEEQLHTTNGTNGSLVGGAHTINTTNTTKISNTTTDNTTTDNTTNTAAADNINVSNATTNNNSKEEVIEKSSSDETNNSTSVINEKSVINENENNMDNNENETQASDYLLYGILGLIVGVLLGVVVICLYNI